VAEFLQNRWEAILEEKIAGNSPERTEEIIRHALPLLVALTTPECRPVRDDKLPDVALVFERSAGRTGISICTQAHMTSLAACLRRLKDQIGAPRLQRLVIVRDGRVPISPTARKARSHLEELESLGAVVIHPSPEVLAALDALRDLLSDSKSGDLDFQGAAVSPQNVEEWLRSNLDDSLRNWVDDVLTDAASNSATQREAIDVEAIATLLEHSPALLLSEAAATLQRPVAVIEAVARRHPGQFGLVGDPPEVLFRVIHSGEPGN